MKSSIPRPREVFELTSGVGMGIKKFKLVGSTRRRLSASRARARVAIVAGIEWLEPFQRKFSPSHDVRIGFDIHKTSLPHEGFLYLSGAGKTWLSAYRPGNDTMNSNWLWLVPVNDLTGKTLL